MPELANFPHISQRDGDVNSVDDCVPASLAMGLQWLTGHKYTAGQIKDAVYGHAYTGGTAASAYVAYCRAQGVDLVAVNGNGGQLVTAIKRAIAAGHPAILTEPDPYEAGMSHVCAAYKYSDLGVTVVDPWIDADITKSDAEWAAQLEFNQIWYLAKRERTTWLNSSQQQQAQDYWNSTTALSAARGNAGTGGIFPPGQTPNYGTGIAKKWQQRFMNGEDDGPPIGYEFSTVDWRGKPIVTHWFVKKRCEWYPNIADSPNGKQDIWY